MRAAIRSSIFAGGGGISFTTTQPKPSFSPSENVNEVFVKVHAAAINPVDYKVPKVAFGPIYGLDFSGVIENVGKDVTDFKIGDEVFGGTRGSMADYCVSSTDKIAKKDKSLSFAEAAALHVPYVTSLQAIEEIGKVDENSSVLIIGASGGCGISGIQLAKAIGTTRIVAICSGKNRDFVKDAGATEVIDYTNQEESENFFKENQGKFDLVYDTATGSGKGENYTEKSLSLLVKGSGEYVQLNGTPIVWMKKFAGMLPEHQHLIITKKTTRALEKVMSLLRRNGQKPYITRMPFSGKGVRDGFEMLKSRRTKGKIVFDIEPSEE